MLITVPAILATLALGLFFWLRAANTLPAPPPPPRPMPTVNARDYYLAAGNALVESSKIEYAVGTWNPRIVGVVRSSPDDHFYSLAAKEKLVDENARALAFLHQGFQYPYAEPPVRSFSTTFPQYAKFRQLARFLSLTGQVKAAQGDWSGAVSAELDAVQMGETLPRGGPVIGMLIGAACQAIGRKHAWDAVPHLSGPEAHAAARRLETIRTAHVPYAVVMQEEKWGIQASLRELMAQPDWSLTIIFSLQGTSSANSPLWAQEGMSAYLQVVGKRRLLETNAQWMDTAIAQARQPYFKYSGEPPLPKDLISLILLPAYGRVRFKEAESDTQNALLVTTLALQTYKLDHGAYPPSLTALVPGYLNTVPTDPFALSGPLRYKRVSGKYLLYSVGPDGKDDGGRAIFAGALPAPNLVDVTDERGWVKDDSKGDVVAGVNTL